MLDPYRYSKKRFKNIPHPAAGKTGDAIRAEMGGAL
jgi:hypothetical protein